MYITWKEVVRRSGLNIPVTTAANYRDGFIKYFRVNNEGTSIKYYEECVDVLKMIVQLKKRKKTHEEIRETLELKYGALNFTVVEDQQTRNEATQEELINSNDVILDMFRRIEQKLDAIISNNQINDEKLNQVISLIQQQDDKSWSKAICEVKPWYKKTNTIT